MKVGLQDFEILNLGGGEPQMKDLRGTGLKGVTGKIQPARRCSVQNS